MEFTELEKHPLTLLILGGGVERLWLIWLPFQKKCTNQLRISSFPANTLQTKGKDGDVLLITGPKTSHIRKLVMEIQE